MDIRRGTRAAVRDRAHYGNRAHASGEPDTSGPRVSRADMRSMDPSTRSSAESLEREQRKASGKNASPRRERRERRRDERLGEAHS